MIHDDSPRWVKLIPSTTYGCLLVVIVVGSGLFGYVYVAQYRLKLDSPSSQAVGWLIAMTIGVPLAYGLSRTSLRAAGKKWGTQVDIEDARSAVAQALDRYRASGKARHLDSGRRAIRRLRVMHRDPTLGTDLERMLDDAARTIDTTS